MSHAGVMREPSRSNAGVVFEPCGNHVRAMQELCRRRTWIMQRPCSPKPSHDDEKKDRHVGQCVRDYVPPTCHAPKGHALGTRKRRAGRHKGEEEQ